MAGVSDKTEYVLKSDYVALENELTRVKKAYDDIISATLCGVCKYLNDDDFTFVFANDFYYQMFGYLTPEDARKAGFTTLKHCILQKEWKPLRDRIKNNVKNGVYSYEMEIAKVTRSGEVIWTYARCHYLPDEDSFTSSIVDISDRRMMEEALRIREEEYRIAAQHSEKCVMRYDIKTKTLYLRPDAAKEFGSAEVVHNMPYVALEKKIVASESLNEFVTFFDAILRGETKSTGIVRMLNADGNFSWYRGDFTAVRNSAGESLHAIISFSDVTEQREKELAYEKWQQTFAAMPQDRIIYYEYDLTKDSCENETGGAVRHIMGEVCNTFTDMTRYSCEHFVSEDDKDKYRNFFARERLLTAFHSGVREEKLEYKAIRDDSTLYWTRVTIQMVTDPYSYDIKAFVLMQDIDEAKREELRLQARSREDPLTGLMNRATFIESMSGIFVGIESAKQQHAFMLLDVDNFKTVNDTLGHSYGDNVLIEVARNLKSILRAGDLVGRLGGDEFMLCLKNIPSASVAEKRAMLVCQLMFRRLEKDVTVSGSIGVSMFPQDGTTFDELYECADKALYEAKRLGRNRYVLYSAELQDAPTEASPKNNKKAE